MGIVYLLSFNTERSELLVEWMRVDALRNATEEIVINTEMI